MIILSSWLIKNGIFLSLIFRLPRKRTIVIIRFNVSVLTVFTTLNALFKLYFTLFKLLRIKAASLL